MTDIVASAQKAVTNAVNTVKNTAANTFEMVANVTNSTKPSSANSLLPLGANTKRANAISMNTGAASGGLTAGTFMLYGGLVVVFFGVLYAFNKQIREGFNYMIESIQFALGLKKREPPPPPPPPSTPPPPTAAEKVLPTAGKEVFNVSSNIYTFYDAEPLCKALGAELATYDQVKSAWNSGADWCNYGWVKGQMAVYPTQKETYDKTQQGPADQQDACGTIGVNGGFFDNPEFRFGVNCYGPKPDEKAYDERKLMEEGRIPRSPGQLKYDATVDEFKKNLSTTSLLPFNATKWSSS